MLLSGILDGSRFLIFIDPVPTGVVTGYTSFSIGASTYPKEGASGTTVITFFAVMTLPPLSRVTNFDVSAGKISFSMEP